MAQCYEPNIGSDLGKACKVLLPDRELESVSNPWDCLSSGGQGWYYDRLMRLDDDN